MIIGLRYLFMFMCSGVAGLQTNVFVDTQIDRLLRRDNNAVHRENSMYNIKNYHQDGMTKQAHFHSHPHAHGPHHASAGQCPHPPQM